MPPLSLHAALFGLSPHRGLWLSIPLAGPMYFNQRQGEGSSWVVIRMIGCEMTTVLFSFLRDSSLVFCVVSSLEDVTEKCKIAQLQPSQLLPIPSARNIRVGHANLISSLGQ